MISDNQWVQTVDHRVSLAVIFFALLVLLGAPAKRKWYGLCLACAFIVMCGTSFAIRFGTDELFSDVRVRGIGHMVQILALYLLYLFFYRACYHAQAVDYTFASILALSIVKIAWNGFKMGSSVMQLNHQEAAWSQYSVLGSLVSYAVYLIICFVCSYVYKRVVQNARLHSPLRLVWALAFIFVTSHMLLEYCGYVFTGSREALFIYYLCALLYTVINYAALVMIAMLDSFRHENRNMHDFISNKMRYYEMSREGIVSLQTKCHDLKHQIAAIRDQAGKASFDKYLNELEDSIDEYSTVVECGHPTIDVVLTEKNILCSSMKIKFSYMIDGTLFKFLTDREIYSLFGNALDNALEGTSKVRDAANRVISLKSNARGDLVVLQIENTCEGYLNMVDGLPQTTKENKAHHGFGLRSIQRLAEKHGGSMSVRLEGGIFKLSVIMRPDAETE